MLNCKGISYEALNDQYSSNLFAVAPCQVGTSRVLTKPYTLQPEGKSERILKTLAQEWACGVARKTIRQRNAILPR